jgi:hypothetical protein
MSGLQHSRCVEGGVCVDGRIGEKGPLAKLNGVSVENTMCGLGQGLVR